LQEIKYDRLLRGVRHVGDSVPLLIRIALSVNRNISKPQQIQSQWDESIDFDLATLVLG